MSDHGCFVFEPNRPKRLPRTCPRCQRTIKGPAYYTHVKACMKKKGSRKPCPKIKDSRTR